jgi:hypothetical protein
MSEMTRENRWRLVVLQTSLAAAWLRRPSAHGRCARTAPELPTRGEALRHARHERPVPGSAAAGCSGGLQLAIRLAPGLASIPLRPLPDLPPSRSGSSSRRIVQGTVRRLKSCLYHHIFSSIWVNADKTQSIPGARMSAAGRQIRRQGVEFAGRIERNKASLLPTGHRGSLTSDARSGSDSGENL